MRTQYYKCSKCKKTGHNKITCIRRTKMKEKFKYIFFGFILGVLFYACDDSSLMADGEEYGAIGTTEWNPLYVYIVNE